mgnify:FL=1
MILKEKILFSKDECDYIINLSKELDEVKPYGYKDNVNNENLKISYSVWALDRDDKTQWIFDKIYTYFENETSLKIKKEF